MLADGAWNDDRASAAAIAAAAAASFRGSLPAENAGPESKGPNRTGGKWKWRGKIRNGHCHRILWAAVWQLQPKVVQTVQQHVSY